MVDISATRIIVLCLRWYLRYPLSYRNLQEMMTERELTLDHSTTARGVLLYAPVLNERIRLEMRWPNRSWGVCETYVRVAGTWTYLYRAIDSAGNTIDFLLSPKRDLTAAKAFLQLATFQVDARRPRVINVVDVAELFATLPVRATLRSESFSEADCALVCQYPIDTFVQQRATRWTLTLASRLIICIYL